MIFLFLKILSISDPWVRFPPDDGAENITGINASNKCIITLEGSNQFSNVPADDFRIGIESLSDILLESGTF
jgi:hypothetical protein